MVDRLVSVDSVSNRLPAAVRAQLADEISDPSTEVGTVLSATYAQALPESIVVRDATGRVASVTENGITETYTRDAVGRIQTITRGDVTRIVTRTATGAVEEVA